jgi:hypothetical protein
MSERLQTPGFVSRIKAPTSTTLKKPTNYQQTPSTSQSSAKIEVAKTAEATVRASNVASEKQLAIGRVSNLASKHQLLVGKAQKDEQQDLRPSLLSTKGPSKIGTGIGKGTNLATPSGEKSVQETRPSLPAPSSRNAP